MSFLSTNIIGVLSVLQPILIALLSYLLYKRTNKANADKAEADATTVDISNFNDGLKYWKDIAEGFKHQIDLILPELCELRASNNSLQRQVTEMQSKLNETMNEKITLKGQLTNLDKIVKALQVENTKLNRILNDLKKQGVKIEEDDKIN